MIAQAAAPATLESLKRAENGLIDAVRTATGVIESIAAGELDASLHCLEQAAENARARLADAAFKMRAVVAGLTAAVEGLAQDVWEDLSTPPFVPPEVWAQAKPAGQQPPPADAPPSQPDAHPDSIIAPSANGTSHLAPEPAVSVAACPPVEQPAVCDDAPLFPVDAPAPAQEVPAACEPAIAAAKPTRRRHK